MPRFSVTLSDEQAAWIREEAAERDRSQADVIRRCIDSVRTGAVDTDAHRSEPVRDDALGDLRDRVADLEARVEELETSADEPPASEGREGPSSAAEPPGSDAQDVVAFVQENGPVSRSEIIAAFREEWQAEGIKGDSWWRRTGREALDGAGAEYTRNRGWEIKE